MSHPWNFWSIRGDLVYQTVEPYYSIDFVYIDPIRSHLQQRSQDQQPTTNTSGIREVHSVYESGEDEYNRDQLDRESCHQRSQQSPFHTPKGLSRFFY